MDRKPIVQKLVNKRNVYFTVSWSRLKKSDKYEIVKSVPADAGIYELYYMDEKQKLCLFHVGKSWYGGLRSEIRLRTDAELETEAGTEVRAGGPRLLVPMVAAQQQRRHGGHAVFFRAELSAGERDRARTRAATSRSTSRRSTRTRS